MGRVVLGIVLAFLAPGCATAVASALHASPATVRAAGDADMAIANAAIRSFIREHPERAMPSGLIYGAAPSYVCDVPGEDEPQTLAASSIEGAVATCAAMNAMPEGAACDCHEAELGGSLAGPIAER